LSLGGRSGWSACCGGSAARRVNAAASALAEGQSAWRRGSRETMEGESGGGLLIANPNCSTSALKPIADEGGIERLIISTYQTVGGMGKKAGDSLALSPERQ
jgi:aspartate-semialdehyde dehydrogenase